jgi:superfamily II DNA helicase RecQ
MKCKTFTIHLQEETRNFEEAELNRFLERVAIRQTFATLVRDEYWSVLVFYEDASRSAAAQITPQENFPAPIPAKQTASKTAEASGSEAIILSPEQENKFNLLKQWRNERAAEDGLPPYMIAQNESLMQIAAARIEKVEDFLDIKGFGEKRAQKYGEEILNILRADSTI